MWRAYPHYYLTLTFKESDCAFLEDKLQSTLVRQGQCFVSAHKAWDLSKIQSNAHSHICLRTYKLAPQTSCSKNENVSMEHGNKRMGLWTSFGRPTTELQETLGSSNCGDETEGLRFYFCWENSQLFIPVTIASFTDWICFPLYCYEPLPIILCYLQPHLKHSNLYPQNAYTST